MNDVINIKVGDLVRITKSPINWVSSMDKNVGKIVVVTKVYNLTSIKFDGSSNYCWDYDNGHFELVHLIDITYDIF